MSETMKTDITIIGGGISGLSTACLLAGRGLNIVCIDKADPNVLSIADERTTAVSYGTCGVLKRAGIWDFVADKACPIRDIRITDGDSSLLLNFLSDEVDGKIFGWIAENKDLRDALYARAAQLENLTHIAPETVSDFEITDNRAVTILQNGDRIESALIIGADGRGSFTRKWMDIPERGWSYHQRAVVCIVRHEKPHRDIAVENFLPDGPFAVLPMTDDPVHGYHRSSIVWSEHQKRIGKNSKPSLMDLNDEAFRDALQERFPAFYGRVDVISRRLAYPLNLIHAADYIGPRMALVADAAHGIHPIAGQGLNLGFRDIEEICNLLIAAHEKGDDLGAADLLETYQRRRRPDNMAMVAVTDVLNRLFGNNIPPVKWARRLGLRATARIKPVKRFFMRQAMADRG